MKITLKDGNLCIDASAMMEAILREHPELVESVSTDDRVIDFVAQQIISGDVAKREIERLERSLADARRAIHQTAGRD